MEKHFGDKKKAEYDSPFSAEVFSAEIQLRVL